MRILVCILILLSVTPVFAGVSTYANRSPISNSINSRLRMNQPKTIIAGYPNINQQRVHNHCPQCYYENSYLSKNDLSSLEKYALNRTYNRENDLHRLERLEDLAFGAIQHGDLSSRYKNVENAILSRPQHRHKSSILNNVANYFAGQTTGFTPSLIPYNNFGGFSTNPYAFTPAPRYSNNSFEQYSNGIFGGGWGMSGSDYGTGSSIRILD